MAAEQKKLWGGRFTGAVDPLMEKFNESLSMDMRMAAEDIAGSQAYAKALAKVRGAPPPPTPPPRPAARGPCRTVSPRPPRARRRAS